MRKDRDIMPEDTKKKTDLRTTRVHKILSDRLTQLQRNLLALAGGGPYIEERLTKFPSESTLSWTGTSDGTIKSRKDRAFLINYAARVAHKITQYVFSQGIEREGIDDVFAKDTTKTGLTIDAFMKTVSESVTAGQWSWIGIDRGTPELDPATGRAATRSIAARKQAGDRIFWTHWRADEVVDWCFNSDGSLKWLITQVDVYENDDFTAEPVTRRIRTIWEAGKGTRLIMKPESNTEIEREEEFTISASVVPFVLIGIPSTAPHWFDDVERIQASMLNLESAHHESLIKAVFPQLVIPSSLVQTIMSLSDRTFDEALEMVRGIEFPMMEPTADKDITRFIMPNASDIQAIPAELTRRRTELFEIVGQALRQQDSKQVQSADAKAWDHRDIEATLADNADVLEDGEAKAVAISKKLDTSFGAYAPSYPRAFDLPDIESDWKILTEMENTSNLPESVLRAIAKVKIMVLDRVYHLDDKTKDAALKEVDEMDFEDLRAMTTAPFAGDQTGDEEDVTVQE